MDLRDEARKAQETARDEILSSKNLEDLKSVRTKHLGRKGVLTLLLRKLGEAPPEERKDLGRILNEAKAAIQALVDSRTEELKQDGKAAGTAGDSIDVTLPGRKRDE